MKASPLFNIRSSRAIDEDIKDVTSDYVGREERIWLQIATRNNLTILLLKAINIIKKMNENKFYKFQNLVISNVHKNKNGNNINTDTILLVLNQIKSNPNNIKNMCLLYNKNDNIKGSQITSTCFGICLPSLAYYIPGCNVIVIIIIALQFIFEILYSILDLLTIRVC